jgi:two-component system sensor histidine kinase UhpB
MSAGPAAPEAREPVQSARLRRSVGLRTRLSVLITSLFLLVCIVAGGFIVINARRAVTDEMHSTARLTLDLLEAELLRGGAAGDVVRTRQFLDRLAAMDSTRNMHIAIRQPGQAGPFATLDRPESRQADAPAWFAGLIAPAGVTAQRVLSRPGMADIEIALRADPADEIAEAWRETRVVLVLMVVFTGLVMGVIYFRLGRDLAPIDSILHGLGGIERGDYQLRLPAFEVTELRRISGKFNHMAQVLMQSRAENRRLSQRALEIQEQERRMIARELHDELGQSLTAIKAMAVATAAAPPEPERLRERMGEVARVADHTYDVARQLIQRLRPPVLDMLGLAAALRQLVDRWNGGSGAGFCRLDVDGDVSSLPDAVAVTLYRIIQEGLTNAARHARAAEVRIALSMRPGGAVELDIVDDGAGFDPVRARPGLGLLGMRERTAALGGRFTLDSAPGRGTGIHIVLPAVADTTAGT